MKKLLLLLALLLWPQLALAQTACLVPSSFPGIPVVSNVLESNHVLKNSPGCLISAYVVNGASAGFFMVFNAVVAPGDGAIAPNTLLECVPVAASSYQYLNFAPQPPEYYSIGIVAVFSTGANCTTKTASATAWFHALVQ